MALRRVKESLGERVVERTREVREQEAHVRELSRAEQEERQRIARVLHDDLQQVLFGARLTLSAGDTEWLDELLDQAFTLPLQLGQPPQEVPEVLPLEDRRAQLVRERTRERLGLEVEVEVQSGVSVPDMDTRVLLYQLLRELLFNVVKHARTTCARIVAEQANGHVRVVVEDEGAGFDPAALQGNGAGGLGLSGVRERLEPWAVGSWWTRPRDEAPASPSRSPLSCL